jgi:hypothetical protein
MRRRLGVAALLLAAIVGGWIGFWQASHRMVYGPGTTISVVPAGEVLPVADFVWANLFLFLTAAVVLAWIGGIGPRARSAAGFILAACAIVVCLWRFGLHGKAIGFDRYTLKPQPRADFGATSPAIDFLQQQQRARPVRVQGMLNNAVAGWTAMYGLENIGGPDALQSRFLQDLLEAAHLPTSGWRVLLLPPDVANARPMLDVLNVAYYLDSPTNRAVDHGGLTLVKADDLDIYESGTAWPRAYFSNDIRTHASVAALVEQMQQPGRAPFVSLDPREASAAPPRPPAPAWVAATNYRLTGDATEFAIDAPSAGMIALLENYWPDDIEMKINGRVVPVMRVNHAFRGAVIAAPGKYVVVCRYLPRYRGLALTLSAAGLLLSFAVLIIALRFPQRLPRIVVSTAPAPV